MTAARLQAPSLAAVLEQQHGVASRAQLRDHGVDRFAVARHVKAQRWQRCGPRVVVTHTGPLRRVEQVWAAVLHSSATACLAGLTAAEVAGLKGWEREPVHVVVPKGVRVPPLPGLVIHESRRLSETDVHPARLPPQTRITRSLIDAATWMARSEHACAVLAAGVQQRLVNVPALRAELTRAGRVRHAQLLRFALDDIDGGAHSLAEIGVVRLCHRAGLRPPDHQQFRADGHGRHRYLDAVWILPGGERLVLEIDGGIHVQVANWWDDMAREREVVLTVGRVLRCSSIEVRLRPEAIAADLARAGVPRSSCPST